MTDLSTPAARREPGVRLTLDPSPSSPSRARRAIHDRAATWSLPAAVGDQLALVGSELVTNAALHARTPFTLTLELRDDHVRISVEDQSSAPVALRHYQPDAPTGRGLGVVAMLSQAWGVQPTRDGKVVWAELDLTGERPPAATPPQEQPRVPADGVAAASPGLRTIHFVGVPVEAYLALQEHNDALFRELELISIELATPGAVARPTSSRLASLVDQLYGQFRNQRDGHRTVVAEAQARGERTVELKARVPPASVEPARAYVELLEEADELCRRGELLTPPPPAQVRSLRRWFVEQMAAQLRDDAAPGRPASPPRPWPGRGAAAPARSTQGRPASP
jgi:anti-sigma regulatory factor (Ser/Thr protein kinase)